MVQRFANGVGTVVATCAVAGNAHMVEGCSSPTRSVVAGVASSGRRDVGGAFTSGVRTVVAACARPGDLGVIDP